MVEMKEGNSTPEDPLDRSGCRVMELMMRNTNGLPGSDNVSTKLNRIAAMSRQMPGTALTSLMEHPHMRSFLDKRVRDGDVS